MRSRRPMLVLALALGCSGLAPPALGAAAPVSAPPVPSASDAPFELRASPDVPDETSVDALLVRSWADCGVAGTRWDELNAQWEELGPIEVQVDYSYRPACEGPVTLRELRRRNPDVLILSDVAGGAVELLPQEARAISRYVRAGHGVIGTFAVFRYLRYDNSRLAAMFGLRAEIAREGQFTDPDYEVTEPDHPLFRHLGVRFLSEGYDAAQVPKDHAWDPDDLGPRARYVAATADRRGVVVVSRLGAARTVYVSSMPEYTGEPRPSDASASADLQFLYNAIAWVGRRSP